MNIVDFIEKIQNKPRYVRVWILGLFVSIFTIAIVSLWLTSLRHSSLRFDLAKTKENVEQEKDKIIDKALSKANVSTQDKEKALSLKDALKASVSAFFEDDAEEGPKGQIQSEPDIKKGGSEAVNPAKLPLSK